MKKIFWIAGVVCLMSCNNEHKDLYDPNIVVKQYEENWKKQFGEIDPNQTWNMAKQITAKVSINYGSNVDYIIKFYSGNPRDKKADIYLLGKYMMKDGETSTFSVDVPAGLNSVFVSCVDMEGGHVLKEKL